MQDDVDGADGGSSWDKLNTDLLVLVELSKAGDLKAFEELYLATASWLLRRIRRLVVDGQAEDVLAETYMQAWKNLGMYDPLRAPVTAWLSVIARSRALDHLRRERSRFNRDATELDMESVSEDPERTLSRVQDERLMHASLALLDEDERVVLGLAYFHDQTQNEIAVATGLTAGAVKSLMARAQRKLRDVFACVAAPAGVARPSSSGARL